MDRGSIDRWGTQFAMLCSLGMRSCRGPTFDPEVGRPPYAIWYRGVFHHPPLRVLREGFLLPRRLRVLRAQAQESLTT